MDLFDLRCWPGFASSGGRTDTPAWVDQVVIDSRKVHSPSALFVALQGKQQDGHHFLQDAANRKAHFVLVKQGNPLPSLPSSTTILSVPDPLKALQEISLSYRRHIGTPILAITGSQGKSMLKDLLYCLLKPFLKINASPESYNSQIGVPLSLFFLSATDKLGLIEAGISHPGEMERLAQIIEPNYAILTQVNEAHLSTLGSLHQTAYEKVQLLYRVPQSGWIISSSQEILKPLLRNISSPIYLSDTLDPDLPKISLLKEDNSLHYAISFPDKKSHVGAVDRAFPYVIDLLNLALKASWLLGLSSEQIIQSLQTYFPEPLQTETWVSPLGTTFINDFYCADPSSVALALKHFKQTPEKGRKIFIFGGLREKIQDESLTQIFHTIVEAKVDLLVLTHPDLQPLARQCTQALPAINVLSAENEVKALETLYDSLKKEDTVLIQGTHKEHLDILVTPFREILGENRLWINLNAIKTNLENLKASLTEKAKLMVMLKARAYGTDSVILARFLSKWNVDILGVAHVDEAIHLRQAGCQEALFVIHAASYEIPKLIKWQVEVGVSQATFIEALNNLAMQAGNLIKVHLHVDTGMSRLGCRPEEVMALAQLITDSPGLIFEGFMTHFSCADTEEEDLFTYRQLSCFRELISQLKSLNLAPPCIHAANSSATMRKLIPEATMVRIGLATFGLHTSPLTKELFPLTPALTLTSKITGINLCKKGETISYGRRYCVVKEEERIGVVPIGYFDGLHRHYSNKGYVIIRGKKAPLVGTICMDFFMVNLTEIPEASIGDPVLIFGTDSAGHSLSAEELAIRAGTTAHELITCLGPRIQRVFIQNEH